MRSTLAFFAGLSGLTLGYLPWPRLLRALDARRRDPPGDPRKG